MYVENNNCDCLDKITYNYIEFVSIDKNIVFANGEE